VLDDTTKAALAALILILLALSELSKRYPHVEWLRPFRWSGPQLSPARQAAVRRRAMVFAGSELILAGFVLPMGYVALTVMMFNDFKTMPTVLVLMGSIACIAVGVVVIWQKD
jgi:hypothetical protein